MEPEIESDDSSFSLPVTDSMPSVPEFLSWCDNTSTPIRHNPLTPQYITDITTSPPARLPSAGHRHKMLGRLFGLLKHLAHDERTYQINLNVSNINIMKNFSPTCNIYIRGNNYGFNVYDSTSKKENAEAEEANFEEVKPESMVEPFVPSGIDYSNSSLVACFRNAEKAPYYIDWLHQNINSSLPDREKVKPLKALFENHILRYVPNYNDFVQEFGAVVSQSSYSKYMGNAGKYSKDELKDCLEPIFLFFSKEKPLNNLE